MYSRDEGSFESLYGEFVEDSQQSQPVFPTAGRMVEQSNRRTSFLTSSGIYRLKWSQTTNYFAKKIQWREEAHSNFKFALRSHDHRYK